MVVDDDDRNPYEFIYVLRGLTKADFKHKHKRETAICVFVLFSIVVYVFVFIRADMIRSSRSVPPRRVGSYAILEYRTDNGKPNHAQ